MKKNILFDESYEYNINHDNTDFNIHFDYGTRYNQINMQFSHFHPYYEIFFLLHGSCQHIVEGQSFALNNYECVLLKPYSLHRSDYFEYQPCKRLILSFRISFLQQLFPQAAKAIHELFEKDQPIYKFNYNQTNQLIDFFNQMYKISKRKGPTSDMLITGLFVQFLDKLYKFSSDNIYFLDQDKDDQPKNSIENKIYEITSYIHQNFGSQITLEELSKKFFISTHYLSRQFKSVTGFTLVQYIQETRIKRAQELLLDTDLKIIDIIDVCGFGSISQFNRVFSNLVGQSPSKYRKANRL